jgi:hypothetical protein
MTSPLDGKVSGFGLDVDTLHEFMSGAPGEIEVGDGSVPTLRKLVVDVKDAALVAIDQQLGDFHEAAAAVAQKKTAAEVAAAAADLAAQISAARGRTYTTPADGVNAAGTPAGVGLNEFFTVIGTGKIALDLYKNVAGAPVKQTGKSLRSADSLKSVILGAVGKNKFDKDEIAAGYALNGSGAPFVSPGRNVSSFLPVAPSTDHRCTSVNKLAWFDASHTLLSFVPSTTVVLTSPPTAAWALLELMDAQLAGAQFEVGSTPTPYESFRYLSPPATVDRNSIRAREVRSSAIDGGAVKPLHVEGMKYLNMHDSTTLVVGSFLSLTDGFTETPSGGFDHTDWILASPLQQYTANEMSRVLFYREDRSLISTSASLTYTTPADCRWKRFNLNHGVAFRFQVNEGATATAPFPQPYRGTPSWLYIPPATKAQLTAITGRLYNLCDAWYAWQSGAKFPIAMLGDSTTDGNGTTGYVARPTSPYEFGVDVVRTAAHPKVLEDIVRAATGSTVARVYNLGYTGQRTTWALANIDALLSGAFTDTKMVGISYLNDRTLNLNLYQSNFYRDTNALIAAILAKGMQPFLVTVQPTTMPSFSLGAPEANASSGDIEAVANCIYRQLAQKWGLELVDLNRFGRDFQTYSAFRLYNSSMAAQDGIYEAPGNTIHWANIGHKYRAELIFAHICPRVLWTALGEQIDFASQFIKSTVDYTQITQLAVPDGSWKIQSKAAKATADDTLLQDCWLFNNYRGRLNLTAHAADALTGAYVKLNGVTTTMDSLSKAIGTLEMGLHHIEAWSGATTSVNWRGFKAQP